MGYVVKTEVFEGPFDLLLHLIARQRLDLWQVSLSRITEDYLAEIRRMQELNLEVATEFLVVAATLLELKAARLLPSPDTDTDPDEAEALLEERDLLFARLLQYRAYKQVAALLGDRLAEQARYLPRSAGADDLFRRIAPDLLVGVRPEQLAQLAAAALTPSPAPQVQTAHIAPPKLSVAEAVAELAARVRQAGSTTFKDLVGHGAAPIEVVVNFLALLELYKRDLVQIDQTGAFASIGVRWTGGPDDGLAGLIDLTVEEPA